VIHLFENVERHEWVTSGGRKTVLVTELTDLQRRILKLLGLRPTPMVAVRSDLLPPANYEKIGSRLAESAG